MFKGLKKDGEINFYDSTIGAKLQTLERVSFPQSEAGVVSSQLVGAVFSPDSQKILIYRGNSWQVRSLADCQVISEYSSSSTKFTVASWNKDSNQFATGGDNGRVELWDLTSQTKPLRLLGQHSGWVTRVNFSQNGQKVFSTGYDRVLMSWTVDGRNVNYLGARAAVWSNPAAPQWSDDGQLLITYYDDGSLYLYNTATQQSALMRASQSYVLTAAISPDGMSVVTLAADGKLSFWDSRVFGSGLEVTNRLAGANQITAVNVTGELILGVNGYEVVINSALSGQEVSRLKGHELLINSASFSPDGRKILTAGQDGTARISEAANGRELVWVNEVKWPAKAEFSADGKLFLTTSTGYTRCHIRAMLLPPVSARTVNML